MATRSADIDKVFKALADSGRRYLLDLLHRNNGQTLSELCAHMDMTRQAVTLHLQQLEDANLVAVVWQGREKLHYLNPVPLHEIPARWIGRFERSRLDALHDLKKRLEGDEMKKPDFVYVTYIAATPEKAWQALVDPKVMRQYWFGAKADSPAHENISDWQPGSRWEHRRVDTGAVDMVGKVVEHTPPRRLVFTWARPNDFDDESKHSRVSFEIEPHGSGLVCLTVTHDGLEGDPKMLAGISGGWPQVLSHLKTFLETGRALPRG